MLRGRHALGRTTTACGIVVATLLFPGGNGRGVVAQSPGARPGAASAAFIVVLDPGHGGPDLGVVGSAGTAEKDLSLALALRLKAALESQAVRVVLTRSADTDLSLAERSAAANAARADLLISLHANGAPLQGVAGTSILVADFDDGDMASPRPATDRVPTPSGGSRTIEFVPWRLAQLPFVNRSRDGAEAIGHAIAALRGVPPTLAEAPLGVLASAVMPAVLVEAGFLSNPDEEAELTDPQFQAGFAAAIADAVQQFRETAALRLTP